ncbi:MAG: hypothetical protein Tsb006_4090 [Rickettsiaceae bacterium]
MKNTSIIAKLSHKIVFLVNTAQSEIETPDWQPVIETFAEVKPACNNRFISLEGMQFGNVITEEYFLFKIRYMPEIHKDMRINFQGKIFEIKRIVEEGMRGHLLNIIALEI